MIKWGKRFTLVLITILVLISLTPFFTRVNVEGLDRSSGIADPYVWFSMASGGVLYHSGNFSVGFIAFGCSSEESIVIASISSVSYRTSWQSGSTLVYSSEGSNKSQNSFFYSLDLTHAPFGSQQIIVNVVSGGINFGGGSYLGTFSKTSEAALNFDISEPPSPTVPSLASTWNINTIADNGAAGYFVNYPIAVDSMGNSHIAYTDDYGFLKYASQNGSVWSSQTLELGSVNSLILDGNENAHILYERSGLIYATWTGSNWTTQTVDPQGGKGSSSLALDSSGNPHVAYTDGQTIKYASWTGSNWTTQTAYTHEWNTEDLSVASLALDSKNTPYILFDNYNHALVRNGSVLMLATGQNSNWTAQNIAATGDYGNMALDSKGFPHLIYELSEGYDYRSLLYDSWNGISWNTQTLVSNASLSATGFLGIDAHDYPHITYAE